jgi:hypothetical protein
VHPLEQAGLQLSVVQVIRQRLSRPVGEGGMYFRRGDDVGSVEITA